MFTIILKNEKLTSYNRLGLFILLIHLLYFTGYLLKAGSNVNFIVLIAGMAISLICFVLNTVSISKKKKVLVPFVVVFMALAIIWGVLESFWLLAAMIVLAFLDFNVRKKPAVIFSNDSIIIHTLPKKIFQWEQLGNVILKDRILTLDFKDDRLIQTEIGEESWNVEEEEFNGFCKARLGSVNNY